LDEGAKEKLLVDEDQARRKVYELLKQNLNQTQITSSKPNLGILNIPPPKYTPISTIPRDSSQALNFEGSVLAIGDYYFDRKVRSIEKISSKRKRGEEARLNSSIGRVLKWKVGPDPKENAFQAASTLNAFVGLNSSFFLEVTNSLRMARN